MNLLTLVIPVLAYLIVGCVFVIYMQAKGRAPDQLQYLIGGVVFWPGIVYNIPKWRREARTRMD